MQFFLTKNAEFFIRTAFLNNMSRAIEQEMHEIQNTSNCSLLEVLEIQRRGLLYLDNQLLLRRMQPKSET